MGLKPLVLSLSKDEPPLMVRWAHHERFETARDVEHIRGCAVIWERSEEAIA